MAKTTPKTLEQKISETKARLQMMENKLSETKRKERNSQLIAAGILVEQMFKNDNSREREEWIYATEFHFKNNPNIHQRLISMFQRLQDDYPASMASPPPPEVIL